MFSLADLKTSVIRFSRDYLIRRKFGAERKLNFWRGFNLAQPRFYQILRNTTILVHFKPVLKQFE